MKFSTVLGLSAAASAVLGAYANGTSTETDIQTTVVTITSCSEDKCDTHAVTTGLTTVTSEETVYTTYCPLTAESSTYESKTYQSTVAPVYSSPVVEVVSPSSSVAAESVSVSSFEGAGMKQSPLLAVVGIAAAAAALY